MVVKLANPEAVRLGGEIAGWLAERGCKVYGLEDLPGDIRPVERVPWDELADRIELLLVLGGDGTMLHAVRLLEGRKVPVLGINLGGLGFLTTGTVEETYPLLERVLKDRLRTEERMMLSVSLKRGGKIRSHYTVLNDAVIKGRGARLVRLATSINREYVTTYRADGMIVATPTGSTAYSLSAQGPILYPTIHSIIIAPICPFNLTNRPVVIPDWMDVEVTISQDHSDIVLVLDGQEEVPLVSSDIIEIKRSDRSVYLVRYEGKSYFDILRERLMWEVKG